MEKRTYEIYVESESVPIMGSYDFIFISEENNQITTSYIANVNKTYSYDLLVVNDVQIRGTHGKLVASVVLDIGRYRVEFMPIDEHERFVLGNNMTRTTLQYLTIIVILALFFVVLLILVIILVLHIQKKHRRVPS